MIAPGRVSVQGRVQWIEAVLAPWRGFIVLTDIRGLDPDRARAVSVQASLALIRAAIT